MALFDTYVSEEEELARQDAIIEEKLTMQDSLFEEKSCLDDFDIDGTLKSVDETLNTRKPEFVDWHKTARENGRTESANNNNFNYGFWAAAIEKNIDYTYEVKTSGNKFFSHIELSRDLENAHVKLDCPCRVFVKKTSSGFVISDYETFEEGPSEYDEIEQEELNRMEEEFNSLGGIY